MTEAQFQRRIIDLCRYLGLRYWHDNDSRRNLSGFPDLVIVGKHGALFAELKAEAGKVRPEQQDWHDDLKRANAEVYLWRPSDWPFITDRLHALAGRHLHVIPGGTK